MAEISRTEDGPSTSSATPTSNSLPHAVGERRDATDQEIKDFVHVSDSLPRTCWIALVIGSLERLAYYSVSSPWQNYMQYQRHDSAVPGALGLGQSKATTIYNAYYFFAYFTPVIFGLVSDAWLGRYKTLFLSLSLYFCGCMIQFVTSLPVVLDRGGGVPGLALSLIFVGLGVGGVKATISPFIGDQYAQLPPQVMTTKSGKHVIVDRTKTLQYMYNVFYWFTNIAGLSIIVSTFLEKERGFWAAFLFAFCPFGISIVLLLVFHKDFVKIPAQGNVLVQGGKVVGYAIRGRFKLQAATPEYQLEKHNKIVPWNETFVAEIKRGLLACWVMAWFVLFYLGINQISNNLVSQASEMQLDGMPNDGIQVLNPIACVIIGPLIQKVLYPTLARFRIEFGPIARMTVAFATMGAAMAYAAGVQKMIYNTGPCYSAPLACPAAHAEDGKSATPNHIRVWVQSPVYVLLAFAEIFGFTTLSEYSYNKAPKDMRTVVQSLRQVTAGFGSILGMALSPVAKNPKILWMYVGLAVSLVLVAAVFWGVMGRLDRVDEELNSIDHKKEDQNQTAKDEEMANSHEKDEKS